MKLLSLTFAGLALIALSGTAQAATDICGNPLPEALTAPAGVIEQIYPDGYRLPQQDDTNDFDARIIVADIDLSSTIIVVRPSLMCV